MGVLFTLPDLEIYYKVMVNNSMVQVFFKNHTDQWNKTESPGINPIYSQLISNKGTKNIHWEEDSLFNKWCWDTGYSYAKE